MCVAARPDHKAVLTTLLPLGAARNADLLQPGVLQEVWVGMEIWSRATAWGLAAAVVACSSPKGRLEAHPDLSVAKVGSSHLGSKEQAQGIVCKRKLVGEGSGVAKQGNKVVSYSRDQRSSAIQQDQLSPVEVGVLR
ncbi:hypothetical protein NDU88_007120 [Pleurodeles waltl]|uniref:Uncharacterized protein n=1 Tax=Pleurodeles waltl TaxID=8319 RepID=A0AAV7TZR9_PLEWA|nr:hypothetical protein NDU88_007120 [Pleurodeles waltl]